MRTTSYSHRCRSKIHAATLAVRVPRQVAEASSPIATSAVLATLPGAVPSGLWTGGPRPGQQVQLPLTVELRSSSGPRSGGVCNRPSSTHEEVA